MIQKFKILFVLSAVILGACFNYANAQFFDEDSLIMFDGDFFKTEQNLNTSFDNSNLFDTINRNSFAIQDFSAHNMGSDIELRVALSVLLDSKIVLGGCSNATSGFLIKETGEEYFCGTDLNKVIFDSGLTEYKITLSPNNFSGNTGGPNAVFILQTVSGERITDTSRISVAFSENNSNQRPINRELNEREINALIVVAQIVGFNSGAYRAIEYLIMTGAIAL